MKRAEPRFAVCVKKKSTATGAPPLSARGSCGQVGTRSYVLKRSLMACHITWPPTSAMDLVNGNSFGQISTQFCA
jgi:hypothetical protein